MTPRHRASLDSEGPLCLADLADEPSFKLKLLNGPEGWQERPVLGTHGSEVAEPMRWIEPDWMMLTTGMRLNSTRLRRELVHDLVAGQASGLGFGVRQTFAEVPEEVIEEARAVGLPLFEVPLDTPFSEINAFAAKAWANREFLQLRRVFSIQNFMLESLQAADPEVELVHRLSEALDSTAILFRPDGTIGELHGRTGDSNALADSTRNRPWLETLWSEISQRPAEHDEFVWQGRHVTTMPVLSESHMRGWLVLVSSSPTTPLKKSVASAAINVLGAIVGAASSTLRREQTKKARLLEELLDADPNEALDHLSLRLAAEGFDFSEAVQGVVIASRIAGEPPGTRLEAVEDFCARRRRPSLIATDRLGFNLLLAGDERLDESLLLEMCRGTDDLVGIGQPASSLNELRQTVRSAGIAVSTLRRRGGPERILASEDLDLVGCLLSAPASVAIERRASDFLAPLNEKPFLLETLQEFMAMSFNTSRTARSLNLHPNSLRYRLNRIESLLGGSLHDPAVIANVHVAMAVADLTEV